MTEQQRELAKCLAQLGRLQTQIDDVPLGQKTPIDYVAIANSLYLCSEVIEELPATDATMELSRKKAHRIARSLHHMMLSLHARGRF
jgi:hypothetical protein